MPETPNENAGGPDPLAELIRAAGRRSEPPREDYERVCLAARRSWRSKVKSRRRNRWLALAASAALLLAGGLLVNRPPTDGPVAVLALAHGTVEWMAPDAESWQALSGSDFSATVGTRLTTGEDGGVALNVSRGGSLRLAGNTEVVLSIDGVRLAYGRLYFDSVEPATSAPFTIATPMGDVLDVGTQFEVSVRADALRIRVREGAISLLTLASPEGIAGTSGEEIELTGNGRLVRRTIAADDPDWAWAEALASVPAVASRSILGYFRWIARETGKRLQFESASVELAAELARFGGDPSGFAPMQLLSHIAATSNFDYRLTEDGAILIGRK